MGCPQRDYQIEVEEYLSLLSLILLHIHMPLLIFGKEGRI